MKALKGTLLIAISMIMTIFAWNNAGLTQFAGAGLALTTLSLTFALSTRNPILEKWFHGIENMYSYHKILAVLSLVLLAFHNLAMGSFWGSHLAAQFGNLAIYLFFSIILVALLGKWVKYESWRFIHRFIFLAYVFGLVHAYLIMGQQLLAPNFLALVTAAFAILGLVSGFYIIFLYQSLSFTRVGKVTSLRRLNHDTLEIEMALAQPLDYDYGQFTFLKVLQAGFEKAPHPFSISGGAGKTIYLTIRKAGDYTSQLYDQLTIGSKVALDRAYGHLTLLEKSNPKVWIAGGIGVTPFLSVIRQQQALETDVHFYYSFRGRENALHLDLLEAYAAAEPHFHLHLLDSQTQGRLDASQLELTEKTTVYMCGPSAMIHSLEKDIKTQSPKTTIVYEGFGFK